MRWVNMRAVFEFQSTLPSRGATSALAVLLVYRYISIHAPLAGSDDTQLCGIVAGTVFQSTLPSRGATKPAIGSGRIVFLISIHAPLAGSDETRSCTVTGTVKFQSTLPSRGATLQAETEKKQRRISIHAPLAGSDHSEHYSVIQDEIFQSTLPSRGATSDILSGSASLTDFNPRSPRGERLYLRQQSGRWYYFNPRSPRGERPITIIKYDFLLIISIHAPLAGSDMLLIVRYLLPTDISIHAPLAGSDLSSLSMLSQCRNFNPRSPRGERRPTASDFHSVQVFQSTLPSRGATLRIGYDLLVPFYFNPRSPRGERP